jgi:cytochrome c oxidase subunit III
VQGLPEYRVLQAGDYAKSMFRERPSRAAQSCSRYHALMSDHPEHLSPDSDHPVSADSPKQLHIPGAGTLGMYLLIASLSVLFMASVLAVLIKRLQSKQWPPAGLPPIPKSLWLSTIVIIAASFAIHKALQAARNENEKALRRNLLATFIIGILFLLMQMLNWVEFYVALKNHAILGQAYLGTFFILTGLHAAHVVGGLIPLAIVYVRARQGRYSRNFHPGVRYVAIYWHFLDVIWLLLFAVIYF